MRRRMFLQHTGIAAGSVLLGGLTACGSTASTSATKQADASNKQAEITTGADSAISRLETQYPDSRDLLNKASGILTFPRVLAAGFGVGGQYGDGVLKEKGKVLDFYRLVSASVGLQIGAQSKAMHFVFMTPESLANFRKSEGWSVGADASVAVVKAGADGRLDLSEVKGPVLAFVLSNTGLMANLTLEGTKITRIKPGT